MTSSIIKIDINKNKDSPQIEIKVIFDWHNGRIGNT